MTGPSRSFGMDGFPGARGGALEAPQGPTPAAPAPSRAEGASSAAADEAVRFSVLVLLISLVLQRFAVPLGELPLSIVGPLGLLCGAFWVLRGVLVFDQRRVAALLVIAAVGCLGGLLSMTASTARFAAVSWTSLAQFLLLNLFALLTFREPVDEDKFFAAFNACLAFVGVAGVLQFFAQFAGLNLFSFEALGFPVKYTVELYYNVNNLAGTGGIYKSNGFFLAEASIYSQFMALGLAAELIYFRRQRYLAVFAFGLILSVSGTGWLVLGAFVVATVAKLGARGVAMGVGALAAGGFALGVLSFASPDLFEYFVSRVDEVSTPGSSGHIRFVTPFWALSDVLGEAPWSLLSGAGAGASERLHTQVSYIYTVNTPLKVVLEYGLPGLAAYLALFLAADRTPRQSALLLPAMTLFLLTGTYAQFPPVLFPILLITSVARLRPTTAP